MQYKFYQYKRFDIFYLITLMFLLLSANANTLSANNAVWLGTLILMAVVGLLKKKFTAKEVKKVGIFSVVFLAFVFLRDLLINSLPLEFFVSDVLFLFKYIYLAALFCAVLKDKAAAYIVQVMTDLAVISLACYVVQLLFEDKMYDFFMRLNFNHMQALPGYSNAIFYTLHAGLHDLANSGFVWEPGAYGCFLIITLLLHFFLNDFQFDKKALVFILAVLTTFSTTAYLGLFGVLFLALRYRSKIKAWGMVLIPVCLLTFFYVPFLGAKIRHVIQQDRTDLKHIDELSASFRRIHQQIPLDRFSSALYVYRRFGSDLILGVSNKYDVLLNVSYDVNVSNGIFEILAQFGVVGLCYLIYRYLRVCYYYVKKWEYLIYCLGISFALGFGEPVLGLPIVLMFMFIPILQLKLNTFVVPDIKPRAAKQFV